MNKLTIIGNLTKDPELHTTTTGTNVCDFTVAVNRRKKIDNQPDADFFRVTAWRERGELCAKYLKKGSKVCVVGPVSVRMFTGNDGTTRATLEVTADDVEFLSSRSTGSEPVDGNNSVSQPEGGFIAAETDELPFERGLVYP